MRVVYDYEKEYRVLVARRPDHDHLEIWRRGVVLEDGYKTAPAEVHFESASGKGAWLRVIMREGRIRQIREVGKTIGLPVIKIIRVRIGSLLLAGLKPREWRHLTPEEVAGLKGGPVKSGPGRGKGRAIPEKARPRPPTRSRPRESRETGRPRHTSKNQRRRAERRLVPGEREQLRPIAQARKRPLAPASSSALHPTSPQNAPRLIPHAEM